MSNSQQNHSGEKEKVVIPNYVEIWKELYFQNEKAWAEAFKRFVSTDSFTQLLNQTMDQQLSVEKVSRQNMDKLLEQGPIAGKKDLARVAELVLGVEEKLDELDQQVMSVFSRMADSMMKLAEAQQRCSEEISGLSGQIQQLEKKVGRSSGRKTGTGTPGRKKKTAAAPSPAEKTEENPTAE